MSLTGYFFDTTGVLPGDRAYSSSDEVAWLYNMMNRAAGVLRGLDNGLVLASAGGLVVTTDTGAATIGGRLVINTALISTTVPAVSIGFNRVDRIVLRVDIGGARAFSLAQINGTPAANPTPATPPAIVSSTDILLGSMITTNTGGVYSFAIVDERSYTDQTATVPFYNKSYVDSLQSVLRTTHGKQIYLTGSGNFVVPANVYAFKVTIIGGGGGGSSAGTSADSGAGGSGATCIKYYQTTPGSVYAYSVGTKGAGASTPGGGNPGIPGSDGVQTTFDVMSAGPGLKGSSGTGASPLGGQGGVATGGDINITGQSGGENAYGGSSTLGGAGLPGILAPSTQKLAIANTGSGGGSGSTTSSPSNGADGIVIIEW